MEFDLEDPLTDFQDPPPPFDLSSLFLIESDHMLSEKYTGNLNFGDTDVAKGGEVVSLNISGQRRIEHCSNGICATHFRSSENHNICRSMQQAKPWVLRIIAVSCVSLSAKMQGMSFSISDIQVANGGLIFNQQTIHRMEIVILGALKWRMRSITPFSFVSFFISLFQLKDPPLLQALRARATEIIFNAQNEINMLDFKRSTVAASAVISASQELFPSQSSIFRNAIFNCSSVNKENLIHCWEAMQEQVEASTEETVLRSDTPINVLDQRFSSTEREAKRRRKF